MNNYKLTIQYDGTNYAGWQIQNNAPTVQQKVSDAIELVIKEKINLIGSGRTDSGVHAWGQVANFRTDNKIDCYAVKYSLNSILPKDISVKLMEETSEDFHSRFDAKNRSYIYLFSKEKSPFLDSFSWRNNSIFEVDFDALNDISKTLIGKYDFTSYSRKNAELEDKTCNVSEIRWRKGNDIATFYIRADRFLHGMVRTIIGTILFAVKNNLDAKYLLDVIEMKNREEAGESVPAKGLFLFKVRY